MLKNINKIAVLRASALGDFICALPALTAIKHTYPDAELVYLGKPWHVDFLKNRPSPIDRVVVVPRSHGVRIDPGEPPVSETELNEFFAEMHNEKFDLAIQMHGGGRNSNPFLLRLDARVNVGSRTSDAPLLDKNIPYFLIQNEIIRLQEVASLIGATQFDFVPHLEVTKFDKAELAKINIANENLIVMHVGASDPRRRWDPLKFAEVADVLSARGYQIALTGIGDEESSVQRVIDASQHPLINLYGKLNLPALVALLASAKLVISNDTGPLHLAVALGTPTVSIFWCLNALNWSPLTREKNRILISWLTHCNKCGINMIDFYVQEMQTPECDHLINLVDEIRPENVIDAALDLLNAL